MGRCRKVGLNYYPFDVDFPQDIRIRKLVKYKDGRAITVYVLLLCSIYKNGYCMEWDDDVPFIISEQTGFDEDYILDVIKYCVKVGLFSEELFAQGVLTSKSIQERYIKICAECRRSSGIKEHDLISSEEKPISSEEKGISSEEITISSEEMPINSEKSAQSKVKESIYILSNDSVQNSGSESKQSDEHITPPTREKPDYEKVVGLWHEVCKSYPRVTKLTDKRKKKVDQRMKELDWNYEQLRLIFEKMEASSFMRGGSWASFDWVFTSEGNMTKVLEGNYDDKAGIRTFQQVNKDVNDLWANR